MTIGEDPASSIAAVGRLMEAAHDPWWIIASAAVALHGADPGRVADVDVLLSVADAQRLLPPMGLVVRPGSRHARFRSRVFATWVEPPLPVEFMAGLRYRADDRWVSVAPGTREAVESGGVTVFVPGRAELIGMLHGFGRAKDIERADRLAALNR